MEEEELNKSLQKVLSTYEGRHVLTHLLERGHVFDTSLPFRDNRDFWDGRRSMGLEVYDHILTIGIETHTMCMKERHERKTRYDDRDRNTNAE